MTLPIGPYRHADTYQVRFDEAGPDGRIRGSALLGIVQDVASRHLDSIGLTREWHAERGIVWLVRAVDLRLIAPIGYGETLRVETAAVGWRRVAGRRETRVEGADGEPRALVLTDWVLIEVDGGPMRITEESLARFPGLPSFEPLRVDRADPPADASALALSIRLRDLDPVDHVNNGVYLDLLDESVAAAGGSLAGTYPRRTVLEYVGAATRGDDLVARAWRTPGGWAHRLERVADGATLLRGATAPGLGAD